jgi:hypothetical protein
LQTAALVRLGRNSQARAGGVAGAQSSMPHSSSTNIPLRLDTYQRHSSCWPGRGGRRVCPRTERRAIVTISSSMPTADPCRTGFATLR